VSGVCPSSRSLRGGGAGSAPQPSVTGRLRPSIKLEDNSSERGKGANRAARDETVLASSKRALKLHFHLFLFVGNRKKNSDETKKEIC